MVKVTLYNLLRSKYRIPEVFVSPGTINEIIQDILAQHPAMKPSDFENAVVFFHGKPLHKQAFETRIEDEQEIIITHFVGGG